MEVTVEKVQQKGKETIERVKTAIIYPFSIQNSIAFAGGGGCKCHCNCNCQCEKGK